MASLNKQKKRARRAKVKARQLHVSPNNHPTSTPSHTDSEFGRAHLPFDFVNEDGAEEYDWLDDDSDDDVELNPEEEALWTEVINEQFLRMKKAESISRRAMLLVFLRGPLGLMALGAEQDEPIPGEVLELLLAYHHWAHGIEISAAIEAFDAPDFRSDFFEMLAIVEFEALEMSEDDSVLNN